jgi:hypothetical protein
MSTCPTPELHAAALTGELTAAEQAVYTAHLALCPACRAEATALRGVADALRAVPQVPAPDLADAVLARTIGTADDAHATWHRPFALAASLALLATTVWLAWPRRDATAPVYATDVEEPEAARELAQATAPAPRTPPAAPAGSAPPPAAGPSVTRALDWLISAQEADGSWAPQRWGAQANYSVGVTALAMLALLTDETGRDDTAAPALQRAVEYLVGRQDPQGLFGPEITGSLYNHALACLALLEVEAQRPGLVPPTRLEAALQLLARAQRDPGGWSYLRARHGKPNTSLTAWALLALIRADDLGRHEYEPAITRALAWLDANRNAEGRVGYRRPDDYPHGPETLTAAAALCLLGRPSIYRDQLNGLLRHVREDLAQQDGGLDLYRTFFQASALREAGLGDSPEMKELLARLEQAQQRDGTDAGSWPSDDRWALAGGPVYSTAMAVLALQEL